LLSKLCLIET